MLSSVGGKMGSVALKAVTGRGEYGTTGAKLEGEAWICGRTTMQQHFAEDAAVPLTLKSVERRDNDTLWIWYEVFRSS
jgi:hypothetical protein